MPKRSIASRQASRGNGAVIGSPRLRPRDRPAPARPPLDVLGGYERGLDVDLGELRLPVGPQVLVPETAGDLEVPVVARDHQQLLVDLRATAAGRRTRRGAPGSAPGSPGRLPGVGLVRIGVSISRNSSSLSVRRARCSSRWRSTRFCASSGRRRSSTRCLSRSSSAGSSSPSFRATGMAGVTAGPTTSKRGDPDLDLAGGQRGVAGPFGSQSHRAGHQNHALLPTCPAARQSPRPASTWDRTRAAPAVSIAEVDENQPAEVADPVNPAAEADGLAGVVPARGSPQRWVRRAVAVIVPRPSTNTWWNSVAESLRPSSASRTGSRRTSRAIRLSAFTCSPAALSGPTSRKKSRTGSPSRASNGTPRSGCRNQRSDW